ncbi:methyltransferase [Candidatus Fermentibacteria bacterium]|nr:MAG: methyltransferase [Candidatus Fermentibacteria bacterium]
MVMPDRIEGLSETMLIPLWARAVETERKNGLIKDPKACGILRSLDYDFNRFKGSRFSQLGVSIRTMILDRMTSEFLTGKDSSIVVNLGAGLDTRCDRFSGENVHWIDVDLPQVIRLRRQFFTENSGYTMLEGSAFQTGWMDFIDSVRDGRPLLIIAEGLLMYFEEEKVRKLIHRIAGRFPDSQMLLEILASFMVGKAGIHDALKHTDSMNQFLWAEEDSGRIAAWHDSIEILEEDSYTDHCRARWGIPGLIMSLPGLKNKMNNRIIRLEFQKGVEVNR